MKNIFSKPIRRAFELVGYDIVKYDHRCHPLARRHRLLRSHGINLVLDVGGNVGRYAIDLRKNGFQGRIVSFEPLMSAYRTLCAVASKDELWDTANFALGDHDGHILLNVSRNGASNSILDILPQHVAAAPDAQYVAVESVSIRRLDSVFHNYCSDSEKVFVKIDAQGYEKRVLAGATSVLEQVVGMQLEVSIAPLYEGEALLNEMLSILSSLNFELMSVEPGLGDPGTGRLLQMDCIFYKAG